MLKIALQYNSIKFFIILFVITIFWDNSVEGNDEYCYATDLDRTQNKHFSTKTSYQFVKGSTTHNDYFVPGSYI